MPEREKADLFHAGSLSLSSLVCDHRTTGTFRIFQCIHRTNVFTIDFRGTDRLLHQTPNTVSLHPRAVSMSTFLDVLCILCATTSSPPHPEMPRLSGDIRYRHERVGRDSHLLRLSTTDFILDSDEWRERRLLSFAVDFASQACRGPFRLGEATRGYWPNARPVYSKQYLFRCGPPTASQRS